MLKEFNIVFEIRQIVYLITDPDQRPFIVTRYLIGENEVAYEINHSDMQPKWVNEFELSDSRDIVFATGGEINSIDES